MMTRYSKDACTHTAREIERVRETEPNHAVKRHVIADKDITPFGRVLNFNLSIPWIQLVCQLESDYRWYQILSVEIFHRLGPENTYGSSVLHAHGQILQFESNP